MDVNELAADCATIIGDSAYGEISLATWARLFKMASQDARTAGWVLPHEDDESITIADNTWSYGVPAQFAYVSELRISEDINSTTVYLTEIPKVHWEIRLDGGVPVFEFLNDSMLLTDRKIKVIGQRRPKVYNTGTDTIEPEFESFLRERALYHAYRIVGRTNSALADWRQRMSTQAWQTSEALLRDHPQQFRQDSSSVYVPTR